MTVSKELTDFRLRQPKERAVKQGLLAGLQEALGPLYRARKLLCPRRSRSEVSAVTGALKGGPWVF